MLVGIFLILVIAQSKGPKTSRVHANTLHT